MRIAVALLLAAPAAANPYCSLLPANAPGFEMRAVHTEENQWLAEIDLRRARLPRPGVGPDDHDDARRRRRPRRVRPDPAPPAPRLRVRRGLSHFAPMAAARARWV